jgi:lysophospholipase L1-like esterase
VRRADRRRGRVSPRLAGAIFLAFAGVVSACAAGTPCPTVAAPLGLEHFYESLDGLKQGGRTRPVNILHLGDSHIALDHLTGVLRSRWASEFGDAGRGLPPGNPYRYYAPQGYAVTMTGPWEVASSLPVAAAGPFGVEGFRVSSASAAAEMVLETQKEIGAVEIEAGGGPEAGSLLLQLDGAAPLRLSTRASMPGLVRLRVPAAAAHRVTLSPAGDGPVTLFGWAMLAGPEAHGGIRYDSYGVSGATMDITGRWDEAVSDAEIGALAPDLVILGYGTNEGFNDTIDLKAYGERFEALIRRIQRLSPGASVAVLGTFDGARKAKDGDGLSCGEGWATPPKLDALREVQREAARQTGAWFFDGSRIMGRPCGMAQWVRAQPPLAWPDHVHLRPDGARRAAEAIWAGLMGPYEARSCRPR